MEILNFEEDTTCQKKTLQTAAGIHGEKPPTIATWLWKMFYRGMINNFLFLIHYVVI